MSVEKLKQEHNVVTRWIHFPLHPETPDKGVALAELFKDRPPEQLQAMKTQFKTLMRDAGLPYGERSMTYNSRLAQELGAWADATQENSAIHDLLFTAYFVENRNISDINVLLGLAAQAGLDNNEARRILEGRIFSPQVNSDWERAWKIGVTGVPTFTSKDLYLVGCQPYEVLEKFLQHLHEKQQAER